MGKEFFEQAYNEDIGLEQASSTPTETEVESTETVQSDVVTPTEVNSTETTTTTPDVVEPSGDTKQVETPKMFNIDGEEVSLDVIKEWKQGNMRQNDYTRKTQELAKQKKELEELRKANPTEDGDEHLNQKSPEVQRIEKLEFDLAVEKLNKEVSYLKEKYPDFDEVKVLSECDKRGIYDDIEFVYKALRDAEPSKAVDIDAIKQQAIDEYKTTLAQEIAKDKEATSGSIVSSTPGQPPTDYSDMLSDDEKAYCRKRGWSHETYAKMKSTEYKL